MTESKIYNVLTHFDKVEQNRLRKYVRSPYFNVNETLMAFYDILADHINANGKAGQLTSACDALTNTSWKGASHRLSLARLPLKRSFTGLYPAVRA